MTSIIPNNSLFLVEDGGVSKSTTFENLRDNISAIATPSISDIKVDGVAPTAAGTSGDPIILNPSVSAVFDLAIQSAETITVSGVKNHGFAITDESVGAGNRFSQGEGNVSLGNEGAYSFKFDYQDAGSTDPAVYTGKFVIGTVHFQWEVNQLSASTIVADQASTLTGSPYVGLTLTAVAGTATGGYLSLSYAIEWQISDNGTTWSEFTSPGTSLTYTLVSGDAPGKYFRVVTVVSDEGGQSLEMPSSAIGPTVAETPASISSLTIDEEAGTAGRFTDTDFTVNAVAEGTPTPSLAMKAKITGSLSYAPSTDTITNVADVAETFYDMEQSLLIEGGGSEQKGFSTTMVDGDKTKWTLSTWVKRTETSADRKDIFGAYYSDNNRNGSLYLQDDKIKVDIGSWSGSYTDHGGNGNNILLTTTDTYTSTSAWMHIVLTLDTSIAAEADRIKLWVDGVRVTSFSSEQYPAQNAEFYWNLANVSRYVGQYTSDYPEYSWPGYMAETVYLDGIAEDASVFGTFDNLGEWIPTEYTVDAVAAGPNSLHLKFDPDAAEGVGEDSSGKGNHLTANGYSGVPVLGQEYCPPDGVTSTYGHPMSRLYDGNLDITNNDHKANTFGRDGSSNPFYDGPSLISQPIVLGDGEKLEIFAKRNHVTYPSSVLINTGNTTDGQYPNQGTEYQFTPIENGNVGMWFDTQVPANTTISDLRFTILGSAGGYYGLRITGPTRTVNMFSTSTDVPESSATPATFKELTFASDKDLSYFSADNVVNELADSDTAAGEIRSVDLGNNKILVNNTTGDWTVGNTVSSNTVTAAVTELFVDYNNATGDVTDLTRDAVDYKPLVATELKFPATMPDTAKAPDSDLPAGSVLEVDVKATNTTSAAGETVATDSATSTPS